MKIQDTYVDPIKTMGRNLVLTDVTPRYVYDRSGHRTSDVRGYYYNCVCLDRGYMAVRVAIDGPRLIDDATVADNPAVVLDSPAIKLYYANGEYRVAVRASGIRVTKPAG